MTSNSPKSNCKGVFFIAKRNRWKAKINYQNKNYFLGEFAEYNEAVAVRKEAEKDIIKFMKNKEIKNKKKNDIVGKNFGRLKVLEKIIDDTDKFSKYKCLCKCGNVTIARKDHLINGGTVSCGCKRLENLQPARKTVKYFNGTNISYLTSSKTPKNNTSGQKGVYWIKERKKWLARIKIKRKCISLGAYKKYEDAVKARKRGEKLYHQPIIDEYEKNKKIKQSR
jgi:hypothetical protein